ncbi:hypothetical protein DL764_009698 [Monosporascus ibericus]|uniref:Expansin-like EG45 domain-containing protein n=1 Tax=Monosporascus ibericus TaxID=155417 RepID=A0A4Q4SUA0_9PEZI|nr:hypothetical protein DL764_009698 [Monosporascus ibericus]
MLKQVLVVATLCANALASPAAEVLARANQGKASSYGGNLDGGNCMFSGYSLPSGVYGTALSGSRWNSAAQCGSCVSVKGPNGKTIKAMVVDKCPECDANKLDLFQNAFTQIGDLSQGIIDITWDYVPCGITGPLKVRNKSGTSAYLGSQKRFISFSMQVVNSNSAVTALDVSTDGGKTWQPTVRQDYNYFQKGDYSGFGTDKVTVKVKCSSGKTMTLSNIGVQSSSEYTASGNC